jgi:hypothetical protein
LWISESKSRLSDSTPTKSLLTTAVANDGNTMSGELRVWVLAWIATETDSYLSMNHLCMVCDRLVLPDPSDLSMIVELFGVIVGNDTTHAAFL